MTRQATKVLLLYVLYKSVEIWCYKHGVYADRILYSHCIVCKECLQRDCLGDSSAIPLLASNDTSVARHYGP